MHLPFNVSLGERKQLNILESALALVDSSDSRPWGRCVATPCGRHPFNIYTTSSGQKENGRNSDGISLVIVAVGAAPMGLVGGKC